MKNNWLQDLISGVKLYRIWGYLGIEDIRQRYVRTMLGPWWLVIGSLVWTLTMGFVMSTLFGQTLKEYLPFIATGMITWSFITGIMGEACYVFIMADNIIKSMNLPLIIHVLRFVTKHFGIFLHNLPIIILMIIIFQVPINSNWLLIFPALIILLLNAVWISVVLGMMNTRFRDTQQIVLTSLTILPFITPLYWNKGFLSNKQWIGDINPFYHAVEILRAPMLGQAPKLISWMVMSGLLIGGMMMMCYLYKKCKHRIIFWL